MDERAVYERLGVPVAVFGPGLHVHLPWPFGILRPVEFGVLHDVAVLPGPAAATARPAMTGAEDAPPPSADRLWDGTHPAETTYLIASEASGRQGFQIVDVDLRLIWRIGLSDAAALAAVTNDHDPGTLVRTVAGHVLAINFGQRTLPDLLADDRQTIAADLRRTVQQDLDRLHTGIDVVAIVIEAIHPPPAAVAAYHAVQAAQIRARIAVADQMAQAAESASLARQTAAYDLDTARIQAATALSKARSDAALFADDRLGFQRAGHAFLLERWFGDLISGARQRTARHRGSPADQRGRANHRSAPAAGAGRDAAGNRCSQPSASGGELMSLLHVHHHGDAHDERALHSHESGAPVRRRLHGARYLAAALIVAAAVLSACLVLIGPGDAVVVTRFGNPVGVITRPGLAWRLPAPIEDTIPIDLRLRTTSSGLQDVGTRDGLRVLMQAYVAWQVPGDAAGVQQFVRAVRNRPDQAADQLRSFIASALEVTASGFALADLVNTDPAKVQIGRFEQVLQQHLQDQVLNTYGIAIRQVGLERLTLPAETLDATVARMRADRLAVATARMAEGERQAAEIRSNADRDARISVANAQADAAAIEAKARAEAADIYGKAYRSDPALYTLLRSLDTLDQVVSGNTRLILRTDAAPFRVFVDGPDSPAGDLPALPGAKP